MTETTELDFDSYDTIFKALANEERLKIMYLLYNVDDKVTVSEFAYVFRNSQSDASRQLKILKDAKLLTRIREGKFTYYSVASTADPFIDGIARTLSTIPRDYVAKEVARCKELVAQRGGVCTAKEGCIETPVQ